ncbi:ABC transporter permease [Yinghuangia seranimata]|uniref:ABC transporter permease n=1 Tax=Yinghuangia seranimata TaxID=408067 RepID=UPI00248C971D|nr:ABC transporter permease [Yinghuangia seranimata]MDI2126614.1 ABC transporter permease [Yinghuangia seranimata]
MTTVTARRGMVPEGDAEPEGRVGFGAFLNAEWIKVRTVRSTFWTLVTMAALSIGLTVMICAVVADSLSKDVAEAAVTGKRLDAYPDQFVFWGMTFGQIAALVLGVLVMSAEYATGMIRSTLTAMPRRTQAFLAKASILAVVLLVLGMLIALISYLAGNPFLEAKDIGVELSDPGVGRALIGNGLYLAVLGLFGFALAALLRHTAGAITIGLALIYVIGGLVGLLPGKWGEWVTKLMPGNAGGQVAVARRWDDTMLSPWVGFGVFCAEVGVLLILGWFRFTRKDA